LVLIMSTNLVLQVTKYMKRWHLIAEMLPISLTLIKQLKVVKKTYNATDLYKKFYAVLLCSDYLKKQNFTMVKK